MAVAEVLAGRFKLYRRGFHHGRDDAIGESRNHIGLEGDGRNLMHAGRQHCRS